MGNLTKTKSFSNISSSSVMRWFTFSTSLNSSEISSHSRIMDYFDSKLVVLIFLLFLVANFLILIFGNTCFNTRYLYRSNSICFHLSHVYLISSNRFFIIYVGGKAIPTVFITKCYQFTSFSRTGLAGSPVFFLPFLYVYNNLKL